MRPTNEDEVRDAIADAIRSGATLDIRGGGSKAAIGAPRPEATVLDLSAIAGVVDYDTAELVLTVRPGTPLAEVDALVAERGQMRAFDSVDQRPILGGTAGAATLGGAVAAGVSGRSEEHTSELQSLMRISYPVVSLEKNNCIARTRNHIST